MDKKTKHRILGVLVVAGVVIISLPFFQGIGKDTADTLVNPPAFPDQAAIPVSTPETPTTTPVQTSPIPLQNPSADTGINQLPDDTIAPRANPLNPEAPSITKPENSIPIPDQSNNATSDDTDEGDQGTQGAIENSTEPKEEGNKPNNTSDISPAQQISDIRPQKSKKIAPATTMRSAALKKPVPTDKNGLFKLDSHVWVIQLGSFQNKTNAIRLVNRLRQNGYHAFIQQVATQTRVYVGPEEKQQSARTKAKQLETDMHLSGIVISYKPLAMT